MALINLPQYVPEIPQFFQDSSSSWIVSNTLRIDAADEHAGFVFSPPQLGILSGIIFGFGAVGTGATVDYYLQDTISGLPNQTLQNCSGQLVVGGAQDNTLFTVPLGTGLQINSLDQTLSFVVARRGAGSLDLLGIGAATFASNKPYCVLYTTTWVKHGVKPSFCLVYKDGSSGIPISNMPLYHNIITQTQSLLNIPEIGNIIVPNFGGRVVGLWSSEIPRGETIGLIRNMSDIIMSSGIIPSGYYQQVSNYGLHIYPFQSGVYLEKNTAYRAMLRSGDGNLMTRRLFMFDTPSYADHGFGGSGVVFSYGSGTSWINDPKRKVLTGLIFDQIDTGDNIIQQVGGGGQTITLKHNIFKSPIFS